MPTPKNRAKKNRYDRKTANLQIEGDRRKGVDRNTVSPVKAAMLFPAKRHGLGNSDYQSPEALFGFTAFRDSGD